MDKKTKKILVITSVVMIVIAIGIVLSKSVPPTTSTEGINSSFEDTTVDGLRFSNVKMVGNQLTALVQNTTSSKTSIKSITVKFYDKNNNEIESVDAYIGSKFDANEMKSLDVKTDADLSNLGNVTYEVKRTSCLVTQSSSFSPRNGQCGWNYSYAGTYECNGLTGQLISCVFSGNQFCTQWTNYNYTYTTTDFNINCCNGNYIESGSDRMLKLNRCTSTYIRDDANVIMYAGSIPNTISCSCSED